MAYQQLVGVTLVPKSRSIVHSLLHSHIISSYRRGQPRAALEGQVITEYIHMLHMEYGAVGTCISWGTW